jgi:hypothetical protein
VATHANSGRKPTPRAKTALMPARKGRSWLLRERGGNALKNYPSSLYREVGYIYFNTFPSQKYTYKFKKKKKKKKKKKSGNALELVLVDGHGVPL